LRELLKVFIKSFQHVLRIESFETKELTTLCRMIVLSYSSDMIRILSKGYNLGTAVLIKGISPVDLWQIPRRDVARGKLLFSFSSDHLLLIMSSCLEKFLKLTKSIDLVSLNARIVWSSFKGRNLKFLKIHLNSNLIDQESETEVWKLQDLCFFKTETEIKPTFVKWRATSNCHEEWL